jgi:hypothetical protein
MASVYYWEVWCETEQAWVAVWNTEEPTVCPNNNGHTITSDKTRQVSQISTNPDLYPKGSGVRFRSNCFTDDHLPFEMVCVEGKKLLMMVSKCVFNQNIVNLPHIVFEVLAYVGDAWVIVDQNYYNDLADLVVDSDEKYQSSEGVWTLDFNWPTLENPIREPTVIQYGMKVKVYMTLESKHAPGALTAYTPITSEQKPTWPDPAPDVELAHVCFHCVAYNENEI